MFVCPNSARDAMDSRHVRTTHPTIMLSFFAGAWMQAELQSEAATAAARP
jgi:hypothetical protein